tara:strand:+ start:43 stop:375 length:333 start_codon:yes stop_codon:yes gene_type:complete
MLLNQNDIGGHIAKQDERYIVKDNPFGNTLVLSSTRLHGGQETTGHKHDGQEEVYFFIEGEGMIRLDWEYITVKSGDVVPIEDGVFHKVYNNSDDEDLYFICVFDGKRRT